MTIAPSAASSWPPPPSGDDFQAALGVRVAAMIDRLRDNDEVSPHEKRIGVVRVCVL